MAIPSVPSPQRYPIFLAVRLGLLLSVVLAKFCPAADMKPGDSWVLSAIVGATVLVPGCVGTVYAARSAFRSIRQMPKLRFLWLASALFFTLPFSIGARNDWTSSRRYIREGRSVPGQVIETHPRDHNTLIVGYTISGVDYRSRSTGPQVASSYRPGDSIPVYYYASVPAQGFCIEPRWRPTLTLISWVVGAGILPLWVIGLMGAVELGRRNAPADKAL